jgi:hypothetical protein
MHTAVFHLQPTAPSAQSWAYLEHLPRLMSLLEIPRGVADAWNW